MNPNDNKNNKNNKPGGNWRGVASLVGWALLLTIIFSYASSVIGSTGRQASSINVEYGEFQEMVESGQVARVEFDNAEDILLITPEEGYSYTAEDGTVYTNGGRLHLYGRRRAGADCPPGALHCPDPVQ